MEIKENFSASKLTRFGTGGPIDKLLVLNDNNDLFDLFNYNANCEHPFSTFNICDDENCIGCEYFDNGLGKITIIGGGTNLLVRDGGIRGYTFLMNGKKFKKIESWGDSISVGAASSSVALANYSIKNSVTGLEFLLGIPGTIGGAIAGNAGCFGRAVKDVLHGCWVWDVKYGERKFLTNEDCKFEYRNSVFQTNPGRYLITDALFSKIPGRPADLREMLAEKRATQPIAEKTAGSVFKNPANADAAWKLIDACGLRGYQIGGARVSDMHTNFIINTGNATSNDIERLMAHMQYEVLKKFNIRLESEIKIIGEHKKCH